jgi:DNA-binding transcriptional ArsR family regulator
MVEALARPDSAAGVARRLGMPRQLVNYHLRQLEAAGLVELMDERTQGTRTERILRARARSYLIAPEALGEVAADPAQVADRFSASYLLAAAARLIGQLGAVLDRAGGAGKRVATLTLGAQIRFRTASERNAFAEELTAAVGALVAKYHDEESVGGRRFELLIGVYPAPVGAPATATGQTEAIE